jgi:putative ABC transport system permease protein
VTSGLWLDVRLSVRTLLASRLVSIPAVLTLALAIGANTAVFSVVNSLLLRPLPVSDPDGLVWVSSDFAIGHGFRSGAGWSQAMWEALRPRSALFAGALAWHPGRFVVGSPGETGPVSGLYTSGEFFTTLGVRALEGRLFTGEDDRPGSGRGIAVVISHRFRLRRFGGVSNVIGAPLTIDGVPAFIIGVTVPPFVGLEPGKPFDVALPLGAEPLVRGRDAALINARSFPLLVTLRLRDGQSVAAATRVLRSLQPHIVAANAPAFANAPFTRVPATGPSGPASPSLVYRRPILIVLAGVALVLVVACVNIANLLLARATARRRDVSVRLALGASRWRLARLPLIESLLLAMTGGALGLALAKWGARALVALTPVGLDPVLDWRVAAFSAAIALGTVPLCGVGPVYFAARTGSVESLRAGAGLPGAGPGRLSSGLVVLQVAAALVVVAVAGLLVRTLGRLAHVPLGFDAARVLLVSVNTSRARGDAVGPASLYPPLIAAIEAVPGVERAAVSTWTPLSGEGALSGLRVWRGSASEEVTVLTNFITPGWLQVYGIPLEAGRDFSGQDSATAPRAVVVNEAFVRRFLPGGNVIGVTTQDGQTIAGIAGDAVFRTSQKIPGVTSLALREPVPPTIYVPLAQALGDRPSSDTIRISIRAAGRRPIALAPAIRAAIAGIEPNVACEFRAVTDDVRASLALEQMNASISAFFGLLALLLAAVGLYGVTSYAASRRSREVGVRMALGATRSSVARLILRRAVATIGLGIALGLAAAAGVTRLLSGMLFGITPLDTATLLGVSLLLAAIGTTAAMVPALRASRLDPCAALRSE